MSWCWFMWCRHFHCSAAKIVIEIFSALASKWYFCGGGSDWICVCWAVGAWSPCLTVGFRFCPLSEWKHNSFLHCQTLKWMSFWSWISILGACVFASVNILRSYKIVLTESTYLLVSVVILFTFIYLVFITFTLTQ